MTERCGNCIWFNPEPGTQIGPTAPVNIEKQTKQSPGERASLAGGSLPPVYGKCRAVFQDKDNESVVYDFGTLSNNRCAARDDYGYKLYSPK